VARFEKLTTRQLAKFDMLIAADICFWDELVDPVYNRVNRAVKAGVKQILIADPERPTFHEMAERCVKRHCAELVEWQTHTPIKANGAILVIENA
jgi:predicted nicotinamide N-methyase